MSVCVKQRRVAGFTLIELMVTLVVAAILISIAVPSYQSQVRKSRRTEARNAVMDLAAREERYYSVNNAYTNVALELGYGTDNAVITGRPIGSGYYTVSVDLKAPNPGATPPTRAGFTITATAPFRGGVLELRTRLSVKVVIYQQRGEEPHQIVD